MGRTFRGDKKLQQKNKYKTERDKRQAKRRIDDYEPKEKQEDKDDRKRYDRDY
jgi:hypothetical protein